MEEYTENYYTSQRLMVEQLKKNIEGINVLAANMLHPHEEYPVFVKLMQKLVKSYSEGLEGEPLFESKSIWDY
jgi:hypothetical protein